MTDKGIEAAARSDAAIDGRNFDGLGRVERQRYLDRSSAAIAAYFAAAEPVGYVTGYGKNGLSAGCEATVYPTLFRDVISVPLFAAPEEQKP